MKIKNNNIKSESQIIEYLTNNIEHTYKIKKIVIEDSNSILTEIDQFKLATNLIILGIKKI